MTATVEIFYVQIFNDGDRQVGFVNPMICIYNGVKIYVIGAEIMNGEFCIDYYEEKDWYDGDVDSSQMKWIAWSRS